MSNQRNASSSPLRQPVAASTSRYVRMHQGPEAESSNMSCCAGVSAIAKCLFTRGGSLLRTGFTETSPHRMARVNALETIPATFRTVFAESGRACLVLRW
jgi:hypothetical protein